MSALIRDDSTIPEEPPGGPQKIVAKFKFPSKKIKISAFPEFISGPELTYYIRRAKSLSLVRFYILISNHRHLKFYQSFAKNR